MAKTIGISLGNNYCVVAYKDVTVKIIATGPNNEEICRSCVAMDMSGNFIVGNSAYNRWKQYAPNIVTSPLKLLGATITDSEVQKMKADKRAYPFGLYKLSDGTDDSLAIVLRDKEYTPEQVFSKLLYQLKNDSSVKLDYDVSHAVITVPAYFNERKRNAVIRAANLAGLSVQRLIDEPIAAAISYETDDLPKNEKRIFIVYDLEDESFDLSIIVASNGDYIVSGIGGDKCFGGNEINVILSNYVKQQIEEKNNINLQDFLNEKADKEVKEFTAGLKDDVENVKKTLSQSTSATIFISNYLEDADDEPIDDVVVSRDTFESLIRPLIQRTIDLIEELFVKTSISADDVSNILLVGGSSCIPLVKRMLVEKYGEEKILSSEKPMLAIAEGAAILSAAMETKSDSLVCGNSIQNSYEEQLYDQASVTKLSLLNIGNKETNMFHTTKHIYYVAMSDEYNNNRYHVLIKNNQILPNEITRLIKIDNSKQMVYKENLYSDAENGEKELLTSVYYLIKKGFPKGGTLEIKYIFTEDEIININARVQDLERSVSVIMSRGMLDALCCNKIYELSNLLLNKTSVDAIFARKRLALIVDKIINSNFAPVDKRWNDLIRETDETISTIR